MGLIAHRTPGARWTLIGQPPGNTPLIDGPTIPDDEAVEVVPAEQLRGAVDLVEQARGCVTAALNCTAHPWHGDDRARKWLMDADRLGGRWV
jgi:hypothetical protein